MANSRKAAPEDGLRAALGPHRGGTPRVTVAYSGGLDSSVLLHLAAGAGIGPQAVHVHHGLSPNADAWAEHCQRKCDALGVPLEIRRVQVTPRGQGLEAAAREARYRVFAQLDTDLLLLAHHRDDQAETVLLQALRGGGLRGLAAMPREARLGSIRLLRPLLDCTRADLEDWAARHGLGWIEDESNADPAYTRNRLRHGLLPDLERHAPGAGAALAARAAQFAEWAELLDQLADLDGAGLVDAKGLSLTGLAQLPRPRAANLLRRHLENQGIPPRQHALLEALDQLLGAAPQTQPRIDLGDWTLVRHRDRLQALPRTLAHAPTWPELVWQGEARLDLGDLGRLEFSSTLGAGVRLLPGVTVIKPRRGGEGLRPRPGGPRRTLKNLLREARIPAWLRPVLPLVWNGDQLAWAGGLGPDADALARAGETGWLIVWMPPKALPAPPPPR